MSERATLHVLRPAEPVTARQVMRPVAPAGTRLWLVGTEVTFGGDAGFEADPSRLFCFGIWDDLDALDRFWRDHRSTAWPTPTDEAWHARLRPYRAHGEVNWVEGPLFETVGEAPTSKDEPILTMTTTAFDDDPAKVAALVEALAEVQVAAATAEAALASGIALGRRKDDGRTFTLWRTESDMIRWAYRSPPHTPMIGRQFAEHLMPRSSFFRFAIEATAGTWDERDPLAAWHADRP